MLKTIIVDARENFLGDVHNRLALQDDPQISLETTLESGESLHTAIQQFRPEVVAVCTNALDTLADWDLGNVKVVAYGLNKSDKETADEAGVPWLGAIKNSGHLLTLLAKPLPGPETEKEEAPAAAQAQPQNNAATIPKTMPNGMPDMSDPATMAMMMQMMQQMMQGGTVPAQQTQQPVQQAQPEPEPDLFDDEEEEFKPEKKSQQKKPVKQEKPDANKPARSLMRERLLRPDAMTDSDGDDEIDETPIKKKKAKVVTVYAAKGGVGKTTISTEVATYLALSGHGRGRFRVCIIDYNIDFGDVRAVLGLEDNAICMYEWAMDIKERIENGEDPEDISYSPKEMERYLQVVDRTGLYALCAPIKHEESQDIGRIELDVMMRNLVNNGRFDFVICDTGNNTRDSSMFALIYADVVLLVATQDVTTATCNSAACEALNEFGLNLDKVRLVVNNVMPAKVTGISVQEVEEAFPYECITAIRHDPEIIKANNLSKPIVYQVSHPVTKEFQKIIAFLTGEKQPEPEKPKRSWFKRRK